MIQFENTTIIHRPIEPVFAYLAELENLPQWNYALTETRKLTPGPTGEGTEYRQQRRLPRPQTETLTITEHEPPNRLRIDGGLGPFTSRVSYELTAEDGRTRLTNTMELEPRRRAGPLARLAASRIKKAVAKNLAELKRILEAEDTEREGPSDRESG